MKKFRTIKNKIIMFIFALVFPLSATGLAFSVNNQNIAKADDDTSTAGNYYSGYMKEVSLTNNNFNSSSSTYSISTSLSGWSGQVNNKKTTAGIINTGNTFQQYMTGTYRLSNNPLAKANDKNILMINSKTDNSSNYDTARQGYKSSSITLDANSYYSFQVSFKSDTNYNSYTDYEKHDDNGVDEDLSINKTTFESKGFNEDSDVYISFTYKSKTYYLKKSLSEKETLSAELTDVELFYEDENFVGFIDNSGNACYTSVRNITKNTTDESKTQITVSSNSTIYTCDIAYNKDKTNYTVARGTKYYTTKTSYTSLNDYVYGSMYLDGLEDKDGNPVKAEYVQITSKEWVTFYFFVATGNNSQTVTLDLWLGTNTAGHESSGVVFFDDCHIFKYSENTFWKTYQSYFGKSYTQEVTNSSGKTEIKTFDCVNFTDLRNKNVVEYPDYNFDFEEGVYNEDLSSLKKWKKSGTGNAQVFSTKSPEYFKSITGYSFVGSNLSCEIDEETLEISPNNYVLGLWTKNNYVKVTSQDIDINANEIYKIKASYKISELSNGSAYMFVEENDKILSTYNLKSTQYTLKEETASSAISSNNSDEFSNDYGVIEFYVKGGALYNSSINISLGLGKSDETSTGCVLFDNVTVELATTEEYTDASNKVEFNAVDGTLTISNGNFNAITINNDHTAPYSAQNWTVENGDGLLFNGVIRTEETQYSKYVEAYKEFQKSEETAGINNPYYWASYTNPKNSRNSTTEPDNVMMLANIHKSWQKLSSENISLDASTAYKLNFNYKTYNTSSNNTNFKVSIYNSNGFKLFESQPLSTNGQWKDFSIYFNAGHGASEIKIVIDFGTEDSKIEGFAYFDNFEINKIEDSVYEDFASNSNTSNNSYSVVDLSNFYLNLPTNNITEDVSTSTTPAYTGAVSSSNDGTIINGGIVNSNKFKDSSLYQIETEDDEDTNVFFIQSQGVGSYTIQSNYTIDLEADKYYALTFKLKTGFSYSLNGTTLDKTKEYDFGVVVGLTDFEYMKNLEVTSDNFETFTIYFNPTEAKSVKLYIGLVCDTPETAGSMVLYDINLEESDEDAYSTAKTTCEDKKYDANESKVFVAKESSADSDDTDDSEDSSDTENNNKANFDWLMIPTLITALAIVIAVVGTILKKVKIKKIQTKKKESYDRKTSLNIDAIKIKAKKQKEADVKAVQDNINKFQAELDNLEKLHKQKVVDLREKDKGRVSKETDKEFKLFAQKRTVIAEKIESLNKEIEKLNLPEYLLSLERKIFTQEELKQKELMKISKQLNKEKEKKDSSKKN